MAAERDRRAPPKASSLPPSAAALEFCGSLLSHWLTSTRKCRNEAQKGRKQRAPFGHCCSTLLVPQTAIIHSVWRTKASAAGVLGPDSMESRPALKPLTADAGSHSCATTAAPLGDSAAHRARRAREAVSVQYTQEHAVKTQNRPRIGQSACVRATQIAIWGEVWGR